MDKSIEDFKTNVIQLKDRVLLEIINIDYGDYTDESLRIIRDELRNRKIEDCIIPEESKLNGTKNIEQIHFKELILQIRFEKLFKLMKKLYNVDRALYESYENVFNDLIHIEVSNTHNMNILLETVVNAFDVSIKDLKVFGQDIDTKEKFDIEYLEWEAWLAGLINTDKVMEMGKENYAAHCLFHMTKYGFTQEEISENFNNLKLVEVNEDVVLENEIAEDKITTTVRPWRRYLARTFDYSILGIILGYILAFVPLEIIRAIYSVEYIIVIIPFINIFVEAFLISKTGTTIGKWIFSISIKSDSGHLLSFTQSFYRSCLVWIIGLGFGIQLVQTFTQIYAFFDLYGEGKSKWDRMVKSEIIYGEIEIGKVLTAIFFFVVIFIIRNL